MAKSQNNNTHRFTLLDESVVSYGFRVLITGVDLSQFKRNPIFLSYHFDDKLPIGRCVNVWKENKQILIDVEFDEADTDEEVQRIIGKVKRGFIKMVSAGLADLVFSEDPKLMLEGQTLPTIIKCRLREASIVGIGANHNALKFYDNEDIEIDISDEIKLSDFIKPYKQENQMNKELLKLLNLSDNANDAAVLAAIVTLQDSNKTLGEENTTLKTKLEAVELADKTAKQSEAAALVDAAVKSGKINDDAEKSVSKKWLELFDKDHEGTKKLLDSLPARQPVVEKIDETKKGNQAELTDLSAKSWDELDKGGKLIMLKDKYPEVYADKYEQEFGKKPTA
ncbi:hypothetical protein M2451_003324 [Dysgonomonas sp. PFB1-18]|uniref:hypothetical protein n=1 Tax=unclassified Dysgonomonas TaxID=2630389 RepID=UPI0024751DFA|nr:MULTISPECIES: hypothetical protein [unclassified Dysgonomonas]MDH6310586.1 hypothetical protein [Dysgonomonas sp. PF1-14]MDH6340436.1 hypothetical protein [Dysgonomonas sp. PF1-16]MDH6381984.1 hypothetical protein [Dysgonomonas sp. PFB1-18]MDH6399407.1 hypothetical protein [Dysgonomonas sp. PF1-23]